MKTFILILAMLAAPLAAQDKQPENIAPPETSTQSKSAQTSQTEAPTAAQQPQTVVKPTAKPAQPPPPQQLITFTAEHLNEYENKILDRAETFYNNRMTQILWTVGILVTIAVLIIPLFVGVLLPLIQERHRRISFEKELDTQSKEFNERLSQSEDTLKEYAEEQTEKLKTELISRIDDREDKQTKTVGSNLAYLFTALGGLFIPLKAWDMVIISHFIAIRHSIDGQCADCCLNASHLKKALEDEEITNKLKLDTLEAADTHIESIKVQLDNIADTEQRVQVKLQIKDLQMIVHALIIKKRQTPPPQAEPKKF